MLRYESAFTWALYQGAASATVWKPIPRTLFVASAFRPAPSLQQDARRKSASTPKVDAISTQNELLTRMTRRKLSRASTT